MERQVGIEPTIASLDYEIAVSENPHFAFVWLLCYRFTTAVYRCPSLRAVTISTLLSCRFRMVYAVIHVEPGAGIEPATTGLTDQKKIAVSGLTSRVITRSTS